MKLDTKTSATGSKQTDRHSVFRMNPAAQRRFCFMSTWAWTWWTWWTWWTDAENQAGHIHQCSISINNTMKWVRNTESNQSSQFGSKDLTPNGSSSSSRWIIWCHDQFRCKWDKWCLMQRFSLISSWSQRHRSLIIYCTNNNHALINDHWFNTSCLFQHFIMKAKGRLLLWQNHRKRCRS